MNDWIDCEECIILNGDLAIGLRCHEHTLQKLKESQDFIINIPQLKSFENSYDNCELYKGYKIKIWSDSCLTSLPPIPVYKAETDRIKIGPMESIDRGQLVQAIKDEIDKVETKRSNAFWEIAND